MNFTDYTPSELSQILLKFFLIGYGMFLNLSVLNLVNQKERYFTNLGNPSKNYFFKVFGKVLIFMILVYGCFVSMAFKTIPENGKVDNLLLCFEYLINIFINCPKQNQYITLLMSSHNGWLFMGLGSALSIFFNLGWWAIADIFSIQKLRERMQKSKQSWHRWTIWSLIMVLVPFFIALFIGWTNFGGHKIIVRGFESIGFATFPTHYPQFSSGVYIRYIQIWLGGGFGALSSLVMLAILIGQVYSKPYYSLILILGTFLFGFIFMNGQYSDDRLLISSLIIQMIILVSLRQYLKKIVKRLPVSSGH